MNALPLGLDICRIVRVTDFETTGLPTDKDAEIIEVGTVDVNTETKGLGRKWQSFINPNHPIPPATRAVHHITDAEVADAPKLQMEIGRFSAGMSEHDVFAAHNAKFERHFYQGGGRRWICTMRASMVLWPDAPGFSNQVLRYWLDLDLDPALAEPPHRALPDSYVTAHILLRLLDRYSVDDLVKITENPIILKRVPFGKHKGVSFADVEIGYLRWMSGQKFDSPDVNHSVKHWLKARS